MGLQHPGHSPILIQEAGKSLYAGKQEKSLTKHSAELPVFQSLWWCVCLSSHYGHQSLLSSPCAFLFRRSEQLSRQSLDHKLGCLRPQLTAAGVQTPCWCMDTRVKESGFAGWHPALRVTWPGQSRGSRRGGCTSGLAAWAPAATPALPPQPCHHCPALGGCTAPTSRVTSLVEFVLLLGSSVWGILANK